MGGQGEPDHGRAGASAPAPQPPPFLARGPGSQSPAGGSLREGAGPRRGLQGPEDRGPVACCWVQFGFGPSERGRQLCGLSGLGPRGRQPQVQLVGLMRSRRPRKCGEEGRARASGYPQCVMASDRQAGGRRGRLSVW